MYSIYPEKESILATIFPGHLTILYPSDLKAGIKKSLSRKFGTGIQSITLSYINL
jgi:hypothetical protein